MLWIPGSRHLAALCADPLARPGMTTRKKRGGRISVRPFGLSYPKQAYFVTWPRISPPGLAAVWTLT
jgi:hypothetical protein